MTKQEQAALEELHMTPEQLEQRKEKVAAMLEEEKPSLKAELTAIREAVKDLPPPKPIRKKRSDAGVPKGPKVTQKPGVLSPEQAARLRDLIDTRETRRIELETAKDHLANREGALDAAEAELEAYILGLQGK